MPPQLSEQKARQQPARLPSLTGRSPHRRDDGGSVVATALIAGLPARREKRRLGVPAMGIPRQQPEMGPAIGAFLAAAGFLDRVGDWNRDDFGRDGRRLRRWRLG